MAGLLDILQNPAVEALLPALLGGAGAALSSPRLAGSRGAVGRGIMGAGEGLASGMQTAQQQQRLNMEQQQQPLKTQELQTEIAGMQQDQKLKEITLANEGLTRDYGLNIKDPAEQAKYFLDPKGWMAQDSIKKGVRSSLLALGTTGVPDALLTGNGAYAQMGQSDPAMLHDIAQKAAEAHAAGKETDLQKVHDSLVKGDPKSGIPPLPDTEAWERAGKILASKQIAVTDERGEEARKTKETPGALPAGSLTADQKLDQKLLTKTITDVHTEYDKQKAQKDKLIPIVDPDTKKTTYYGADMAPLADDSPLINLPGTFEEYQKTPEYVDALKTGVAKGKEALGTSAAPPAGKSAAASPGPSDSKGKTPPKEESTPHGLAKYDESKSKKAGHPVYVAPDGSTWG